MSAKMEFASAIFKKVLQTDYLYSKICLTIQIGLQWGNDNRKIKHYLKKIRALKKKTSSKFSKVYYLQIGIHYTFCYYHCYYNC